MSLKLKAYQRSLAARGPATSSTSVVRVGGASEDRVSTLHPEAEFRHVCAACEDCARALQAVHELRVARWAHALSVSREYSMSFEEAFNCEAVFNANGHSEKRLLHFDALQLCFRGLCIWWRVRVCLLVQLVYSVIHCLCLFQCQFLSTLCDGIDNRIHKFLPWKVSFNYVEAL